MASNAYKENQSTNRSVHNRSVVIEENKGSILNRSHLSSTDLHSLIPKKY